MCGHFVIENVQFIHHQCNHSGYGVTVSILGAFLFVTKTDFSERKCSQNAENDEGAKVAADSSQKS